MVPLADGSDMGGSLRNPASFCGVVGLRPSLGRVPEWPLYNQWETTSVGGPLARNVGDLALLLSVLAGPDPRAPQALAEPGVVFAPPIAGSLSGLRVALSVDLGGAFEVDHEVAAVVEGAAPVFAAAGATVTPAHPDLAEADDTFRTLRAWHLQAKLGPLLAEHPTSFKQSLADNIALGETLSGADVARAYTQRTALSERMRELLHDVRRAGAAGLAGAAVPGRPGVPDRDQRPADGRPTSTGCARLPDHRHRLPRDLGPGRHHTVRAAGRHPDRRPARSRPVPARGRGCVRGRQSRLTASWTGRGQVTPSHPAASAVSLSSAQQPAPHLRSRGTGPRPPAVVHRTAGNLWDRSPDLWRRRVIPVEDRTSFGGTRRMFAPALAHRIPRA